MSFKANSAVFLKRSLRRVSKQILKVLCSISQTPSFVNKSPTEESIKVLRTAKIFIKTTSSDFGSTPTNLKRSNDYGLYLTDYCSLNIYIPGTCH